MITKEEKISYLKQFYTDEELTTFECFANEAALEELYEYSQPVEMNIEDVRFANEGGVTLVDSPDGWVEIEQWRNKGTKKVYDLLLANGSYITASHDHLFQVLNGEWKFTRDIKVGMTLLTQLGGSTVVMIKEAGDQVVYDLAINHKNHRYYTNGISSHNSGKSLFLQNLALNWSFMGYDVVYFSLELSEALVSSRLDCMVSNMGTKDLFKRISDASMSIKMTQKSKRAGKVTVKKMPEAGTTTNVLRAYLKEYEIQMGKRPDVVVVDYLDIMYPNNSKIDPTNAFAKDKYVSEELRAMYSELNLLGASASQLNRGSVEANGAFDHSHIAGGISKINTADNVFAIYTNAAMRERGEYQLHMLKTRSSSSVGQSIILKYNPVTMLISDHPDEDSVDVAPMTQADLQQKMKSALAKPSLGTVKAAPIVDDDTGEISNPPSQDPPKQDLAPADIRLKMLSMMSRVQNR